MKIAHPPIHLRWMSAMLYRAGATFHIDDGSLGSSAGRFA